MLGERDRNQPRVNEGLWYGSTDALHIAMLATSKQRENEPQSQQSGCRHLYMLMACFTAIFPLSFFTFSCKLMQHNSRYGFILFFDALAIGLN